MILIIYLKLPGSSRLDSQLAIDEEKTLKN